MGHTYSNLLIHVIFSTKDRRPLISADCFQRLIEYLCGLARQEFGKALKVGGTENHIHGLITIRTDIALAYAMNRWKSLSAGWIHGTFPGMADFAWQPGYASFSVSQSQAASVIAYIERQAIHHRHKTFDEEFVEFLKRHQVEYDPRNIWD
jgi:putative transposase